jgi:putative phage-type endonuclease
MFYNFQQGTLEWADIRKGKLTATKMAKCVTSKLAISEPGLNRVVDEIASGVMNEMMPIKPRSYWMERGLVLEPDARIAFQDYSREWVEEYGFITKDEDPFCGCSPDGIIKGKEEGLEIKCPKDTTHLRYLETLDRTVPKNYRMQLQYSMYVTGFKGWYFCSYHPEYDLYVVYDEPDEAYVATIEGVVPIVKAALAEILESKGYTF